jgi:hypothetical protein
VRVGTRVAFLLSDIAGRREQADPIAARTQEAFRAKAAELFGALDANLMDGTTMLVQAVNLAVMGPGREVYFAPTFVGCYDLELGVLAYINGGGQTAVLQDSEGTRALPFVAMPLGLFTHLTYEPSMQAFEQGARLLVVTKGVTESLRGKVPFGPERVLEVLRDSKNDLAEGLCGEVLEAAHAYQKLSRRRTLFGRREVEDMTALAMVRR